MSWRRQVEAVAGTVRRPLTIAEFELLLRIVFGFSRGESRRLAYEGWRGLERAREGRRAAKWG